MGPAQSPPLLAVGHRDQVEIDRGMRLVNSTVKRVQGEDVAQGAEHLDDHQVRDREDPLGERAFTGPDGAWQFRLRHRGQELLVASPCAAEVRVGAVQGRGDARASSRRSRGGKDVSDAGRRRPPVPLERQARLPAMAAEDPHHR